MELRPKTMKFLKSSSIIVLALVLFCCKLNKVQNDLTTLNYKINHYHFDDTTGISFNERVQMYFFGEWHDSKNQAKLEAFLIKSLIANNDVNTIFLELPYSDQIIINYLLKNDSLVINGRSFNYERSFEENQLRALKEITKTGHDVSVIGIDFERDFNRSLLAWYLVLQKNKEILTHNNKLHRIFNEIYNYLLNNNNSKNRILLLKNTISLVKDELVTNTTNISENRLNEIQHLIESTESGLRYSNDLTAYRDARDTAYMARELFMENTMETFFKKNNKAIGFISVGMLHIGDTSNYWFGRYNWESLYRTIKDSISSIRIAGIYDGLSHQDRKVYYESGFNKSCFKMIKKTSKHSDIVHVDAYEIDNAIVRGFRHIIYCR